MRNISVLSLAAAAAMALSSCTGGGGADPTATVSPTPTEKVYTEDELRDLVSGLTDADGNELQLYSPDQVDQGERIARLLMGQATVEPEDCKSIATAGLLDSLESGEVAIAISESTEPRTVSAQSGEDGPDAEELLKEIADQMEQCSEFTVEVAGQTVNITSEERSANTDAAETFATLSTRGEDTSDMLMQVSAAEGRLLVVATKSGADLGNEDQDELEELVDTVLAKASDGTSPTATATTTGTSTASPTETGMTSTPSPTVTETDSTEDTTATPTGGTTGTTSP